MPDNTRKEKTLEYTTACAIDTHCQTNGRGIQSKTPDLDGHGKEKRKQRVHTNVEEGDRDVVGDRDDDWIDEKIAERKRREQVRKSLVWATVVGVLTSLSSR